MNIKFLEWDSVFFKKNIGVINSSIEAPSLFNKEYDLLYVMDGALKENVKVEGFKKSYEETRIVFSKKVIDYKTSIDTQIISGIANPIRDKSDFYSLAYISGQESRFKKDSNFTDSEFKKLYKTWIDNSLSGTMADEIFYYLSGSRISGIITYKMTGKSAKIGLFAVLPEEQGKSIGRKLMDRVMLAIGPIATDLQVETQEHNQRAVSFYLRYGFEIVKTRNIKHYWRDDSI